MLYLDHMDLYNFTCCVKRTSESFALSSPDIRVECEQVVHDQGVTLPAGDMEGVPAILVPQCWISTVVQQILDHGKVRASAGHHQGGPKSEG